jgi:hypothetical protein
MSAPDMLRQFEMAEEAEVEFAVSVEQKFAWVLMIS